MGAIGRIFVGLRYVAGQDTPGRRLQVRKDDTFLVSYPKSGNTWVRLLVANLIRPEQPVSLVEADRIIPSVDGQPRKFFEQMSRPRVIKSHYPFLQTYKRVVYVVRDPRDVAVSQYHFQVKRRVLEQGFPIDEFVPRFVAGDVCEYGSWGENVASWMSARQGNPGFLVVRYEDLLRRTVDELGRIAGLLRVDASGERLALAVERSTAKKMRDMEKQEGSAWASTKDTRQDMSFVRAATDNQWRTALSPASVEMIEGAWGHLMQACGYQAVYVTGAQEKPSRAASLLLPSFPFGDLGRAAAVSAASAA